MDKPKYIGRMEAARILGCSELTVDRRREAGKIKSYLVNGVRKYDRDELEQSLLPKVEEEGSRDA
ncbi:MAG TPA: hypothetical protein V6C86_21095 [Oculatellaceae cyanobacterium]